MEKSISEEKQTAYVKNPYNGKMLDMMAIIEEIHEWHADHPEGAAESLTEIIKHISINLPEVLVPHEMSTMFHFLFGLRDAFLDMSGERD